MLQRKKISIFIIILMITISFSMSMADERQKNKANSAVDRIFHKFITENSPGGAVIVIQKCVFFRGYYRFLLKFIF
jgi:hypothetical protein